MKNQYTVADPEGGSGSPFFFRIICPPEVFIEKGVLNIRSKFTGEHLWGTASGSTRINDVMKFINGKKSFADNLYPAGIYLLKFKNMASFWCLYCKL